MEKDYLVLVNQTDEALGVMEKLEAHQLGLLHRAFSLIIMNSKGEMLIQKRAKTKYHSPDLWTNACCSHPKPKEELKTAVWRRCKEELGIELDTEPKSLGYFCYYKKFDNQLIENELDHVFLVETDQVFHPNPKEASALKYISIPKLIEDITLFPEHYTYWFKAIMNKQEFVKHFS
ncbi:MAG: isopentenyl-diphosphate Delta-isomerase [Flavobacteriales bacterium]